MQQFSILQLFAIWAMPVLFAITVHEVAHGWMALKCGDKTALMMGRLTLNPIKHIDPLGTILVPALLLLFRSSVIFGWAKPVPVTWQNLRKPKRDMALVAVAGPMTNFIMAILWAGVTKIGIGLVMAGTPPAIMLAYMGQAGVLVNLVLMVLNLIPIPPLDGGRVLSGLLPNRLSAKLDRIEPYGFFILVGLLFLGALQYLIAPPVFLLYRLILAAFGIGMPS